MKVLIYGREPTKEKVTHVLDQHGIETIYISKMVDMPSAPEYCEKPHLVLIDRKAEDAADASERIQELWDIPAVLILGNEREDWQGTEQFKVDGYVQDTFNNGELVARLSAICRRCNPISAEVTA
ncbi:MAG: hypothetical protein PHY28_01705 [Dehalococcoidales bacterium]|nr:hypothetical protein [Dehalococcoidales bacterium]